MIKFEEYKEKGLSEDAEKKINIIRGCILGSFLKNCEKKELCDFMNDLEEYFNNTVEEEDE